MSIVLENVTKRYGKLVTVDRVSLEVQAGELVRAAASEDEALFTEPVARPLLTARRCSHESTSRRR